ncbi:MFS transporter [Actinokineospora iranica]|uniref:Drug resistance transporter, EmrB/QacA subfamily n=1 Tax=Actinokineospora iranica TaxID=1271860 RepID=A0A1G6JWK0_9PSEU|nr:MFS transporter [Actinokineospora iranica]SDC23110.1 drug resistance transporter, EmrB/QacA subfamily [Actinokineospora iranica]
MVTTEARTSRWVVLVLMGLALCVVVLNNSALNVAIPAMMRGLGADLAEVQWIVDSYSVAFAGLLIVAGVWSDRWGRKRLTLGGLVAFAVASLVAAMATQAWQLIAVRAALGVAAAFVMPGTLSILLHAFDRSERATAIAVWSAIAALGVAIGPVLGGLVVDDIGWAAVFLLNVPLVAAVVVASVFFVRESADPAARPTDPVGAVLSVLAIGGLVYTVIEFGADGRVSFPVAIGAVVTAAACVAFTRRLRTAPYPLIELSLLGDRRFAGSALGNMLMFFGLAGSLFVLTQRLQVQLAMSPFQAGLAIGPVALTVLVGTALSPRLRGLLGVAATVAAGMALSATGIAVLGFFGHDYPTIVVGLTAVGIGFGVASPVATDVLVSSLSDDRACSGSAVNDTMQELGWALGVAVVGAMLNRLVTDLGDRAAFDHAAAVSLGVAATVTLVGAALAARLLPRRLESAP